MSAVRRAYRAAVPSRLRGAIWKLRRRVPRRLHDLRWHVAPAGWRTRWTDERLATGPWFWLFVLGCNNSGTTLLVEVLQSHPLVRSLPKEGQRITGAIPNSAPLGIGRVFTQRLDLFRRTEADGGACVPRLRYDWAYFSDPTPGIRLEKSPPNTLRSRWLQRHFAPSRFLVITRNPYAVCEGVARRRGHSIAEAAAHWRLVHEVLEEDMPRLSHVLTVTYEDFCDDFDATIGRIERFLGLPQPFDRGLLHRRFNAHNMDGAPSGLQNFNQRSIARLTDADISTITAIAGETMARWGYAPIEAGSRAARSAS